MRLFRRIPPPRVVGAVAAAILVVSSLSGATLATRTAAEAQPGDVVVDHLLVAMPDGVRLATDVYRPAEQGRVPAILVRTPYGKGGSASQGMFFAEHGYAYVVQDVRGRYASEGNFEPYVDEGPDGYAAAQWIVQQPWYSPREGLALFGGSYLSSTAIDTALLHPPGLKAMYVYIASADYHQDGAWRQGAYRLLHNVSYAPSLCDNELERSLQPGSPAADLMNQLGTVEGQWMLDQATPLDVAEISQNCGWYHDWANDANEGWYWKQPGLNRSIDFSRWPHVPTAFLGGWYDEFNGGTIANYLAAKRHSHRPTALVIGPWTHGGNNSPKAGAGYFGPDATADVNQLALRWFDRYMKGIHNGVDDEAPVRLFLMGGGTGEITEDESGSQNIDILGHWQEYSTWPVEEGRQTRYYLHADGGFGPDRPTGRGGSDTFTYDPRDPVPTMGGTFITSRGIAPAGAQNQSCQPDLLPCHGSDDPLAGRDDVLTYSTPVLERDVEIAGSVSMRLWASSSARDTDFTAKLVDVYPNGTVVNLADGIVDARYRDSADHPTLLQPGRVTRFDIDMWSTGVTVKAGHRLAVYVSSSDFPQYNRNMNTGLPVARELLSQARVAHQKVVHDRRHPSYVSFPVVVP